MSDWRFTSWRGGVAHDVDLVYGVARCGLEAENASMWMGTGTQDEYERAAVLPACRRCLAKGAVDERDTTAKDGSEGGGR